MSTISVIVITYNEAKNITRLLKSVNGIADEIIIIDSFSTDETEQHCQLFNARFIQRRFTDFADQRNASIEFATMDYLMFLDADEELSEVLAQQLMLMKQNGMNKDAYHFNRFNNLIL